MKIARERGLGSLKKPILSDRSLVSAELLVACFASDVSDMESTLEGARDIVAEGVSESAELLGCLRNHMKEWH